MTGNPNCGEVCPSGTGAGVVCSFASFCARLNLFPPPPPLLFEELGRPPSSRNSVARKYASLPSSLPQARDRGHRDGTTSLTALSEACSPSNMVAAAEPGEILTKSDVVGVVRRKVEEKPEPPCAAICVLDGSRARALRMDGSIEGGMVVLFGIPIV